MIDVGLQCWCLSSWQTSLPVAMSDEVEFMWHTSLDIGLIYFGHWHQCLKEHQQQPWQLGDVCHGQNHVTCGSVLLAVAQVFLSLCLTLRSFSRPGVCHKWQTLWRKHIISSWYIKSSVMCRNHIIHDIYAMMSYMVNMISCTYAIISDEIWSYIITINFSLIS
jgi:hypothetical protein